MEPNINLEEFIQDHIEEAIERGWIKAYYQPVVRTLNEKISCYEAQARWENPINGILTPPPSVFVPALEKCNKIHMLDLEILEQFCKSYKSSREMGMDIVPVSFNLSRLDFDIENIHELINAVADKYSVPHSMIIFEITESVSYKGEDFIEEQIRLFHRDGYEVWMDDFGSGYSTFNTLQSHSYDTIKLDLMFLRNFNDKAAEIIRSVV